MIILPAEREHTSDFEAMEEYLKAFYRREIYAPLIQEFYKKSSALHNAIPGLADAIRSGQVTFYRGTFSGKFNSEISKELRSLGAKFDRSQSTYKITLQDLPMQIRVAISSSDYKFKQKIEQIDKQLGDVVTAEVMGRGISKKIKTDHFFDRALWKSEKEFQKNVKNITIAPKLTEHQRKRIADEWGENMQLWIQDFNKKEITELRAKMQKTVFAGDRYGSAVKTIQESYGVTENKAKFLARQETALLMAKYKQTRYQAAGIDVYQWLCVAGSPLHPVRPMHKKNNKKFFRWDDPPTVDEKGNRKNPQQDYNCRCTARPVVRFKGKLG